MKKIIYIIVLCLLMQSCTKQIELPQQKPSVPNLGKNY
jgi:hypothetical protein